MGPQEGGVAEVPREGLHFGGTAAPAFDYCLSALLFLCSHIVWVAVKELKLSYHNENI